MPFEQGSLWAESAVASILIVKLPISLGIAAPMLMSLLTTECYKDSKSHSLLMTCGAELFSLEEFFASIYAVNGHFWRILPLLEI